MEIIKKRILFNDIEKDGNIYLKIPLTQSVDGLGLLTDMPYGPNTIFGILNRYEFLNDYITSIWYKNSGKIISASDSKLERVRSYDSDDPFIEHFNIRNSNYINYSGDSIAGVDRVISVNDDEIKYTIDAKIDANLGTSGQTTGILYTDNPIDGVRITDELDNSITTTKVEYIGEGWNETNVSVDPQVQEEYLIGIISPPEVESDVFIDRTTFSVLDNHLRLSEVETLDHLTRYGNGFYNINRD
jgi:hypothetical protein